MEGRLLVVGCGQVRSVAAVSCGPEGWEAEVCISEASMKFLRGRKLLTPDSPFFVFWSTALYLGMVGIG